MDMFFRSIWRDIFFAFLIIVFICVDGNASTALGDPSEELKTTLEGNDVETVWRAVRAIPRELSPQHKQETIKLLQNAIRREWPRCTGDIRQAIAQKLADLEAKAAISDLMELIRESKNISHECAECGCCFAYQSVGGAFLSLEPDFFCENSVLSALHSLATFSYAKDVSELAQAETPYRPQLLVILGKIGQPRYAHFIAKFADSENNMVRLAVAYALGEMKQPSGVPVLGRLLEDRDESVRWAASSSLIRIAGEKVVDTVRLRFLHPNKEIRALAARTLGFLGVAEGVSLLRALGREAEEPRIRSLAIAYLGQLEDHQSRPIPFEGLKDESILVRTYSIYALGYIGDLREIPALEASLFEAKTIEPAPTDKEALELIDETTREALERIHSRFTEQ